MVVNSIVVAILCLSIILICHVFGSSTTTSFQILPKYKVSEMSARTVGVSRQNRMRNSKLQNINATALVFYGRKRYVQILNCYLEQNLVENGGILTEVMFIMKTTNKTDLEYLDILLAKHPDRYFKRNITRFDVHYDTHYQLLDPERYYFKIDDDIVYIHPDAFEKMLEAKLMYSDVAFISANIINHPILTSVHAQMRAIHNFTALGNRKGEDPYCAWDSVYCGVVQHESFFKRFNENSLEFYMFSHWDFNWKNNYPRWSINLILFQGKDVANIRHGDDEMQISIQIPNSQRKHSIAVGRALVAHFAYWPQRNSLTGTTETYLLQMYANIAQKVCSNII